MKSYFSTNRVLALAITGVAIATVFFACKKDAGPTDTASQNQSDNNTIAASQHEAMASVAYGDLFETVATVAIAQGLYQNARIATNGSKALAGPTSCPVAELLDATDPNKWPKTVQIDFGDACLDRFGIYRSGILNVTFNGPLFSPTATIVVDPSNYRRNGKLVSGRLTISAMSFDKTNGIRYTSEITNGKLTLADTVVVSYVSKRTIKQIAGVDQVQPLLNPEDDVYSIEGTASLSYVKGPLTGVAADFATQEPLIKTWGCNHCSKGKLKVTVDNVSGVINYGTGQCTDPITITVGDKVKEIKI